MICFGYSEGDSTQLSANIPSLNNLFGQKSIKFLGGILENFQTSKGHSEINWPLHAVKSKGKILQNFVAFSEYMNFKHIHCLSAYETCTKVNYKQKIRIKTTFSGYF